MVKRLREWDDEVVDDSKKLKAPAVAEDKYCQAL